MYKDYSNMVQNLKAKDYVTISERMKNPNTFDIVHALLGILSEEEELSNAIDVVNLKEELGDLLFYSVLGLEAIGHTIEEAISYLDPDSSDFSYSVAADVIKRIVIYGKTLGDENYREELFHYFGGIVAYINKTMNIQEIIEMNRAKLERKRYKSGSFSETEALNRDVQQERSELEKHNK